MKRQSLKEVPRAQVSLARPSTRFGRKHLGRHADLRTARFTLNKEGNQKMTVFASQNAKSTADASEAPVLYAMTDMLRYNATASDVRFSLKEIFFDATQGVLRFVALDVGGWFDDLEVVVSTLLMGDPDESTREWTVAISPEAIKAAPEWSDPKILGHTAMPQIMVSQLGGGFAGLTALNQYYAQHDGEPLGNLKVDGFARLSDWIGLPVFGQDGEVGTLIDILFDPRTRSLSHLVIDTGGTISAQQMVVPYDRLLHLAKSGSHLVMDVTEKLLREAPPLEHFDMLNRAWLDKLRAYYQLMPRL
ncbi:MAG: PRC-barrel domain-containing protein [Sulfitobacter sp.]